MLIEPSVLHRYLVVDNFVTRELAARIRTEAHMLQRQGEQLSYEMT